MGLFDTLTDLGSAVVNTAMTPVDIVKDVVTDDPRMSGRSRAEARIDRVKENLEDAADDLFK